MASSIASPADSAGSSRLQEALQALPELDHAVVLCGALHADEIEACDEIRDVLRPPEQRDQPGVAGGMHDYLGICAHWRGATQDIDFERKLLLRALLSALRGGMVVLFSCFPMTTSVPTHPRDLREHMGTQQGVRSA